MLRTASNINKNIAIGIILALTVLLQELLIEKLEDHYTILIFLGLSVGFYTSFGKKILPGIVIGLISSGFLIRIIIGDTFIDSISFGVTLCIISLVALFIFDSLLRTFDCKSPETLKVGSLYLLAILITSFIVSIPSSIYVNTLTDNSFFLVFSQIFKSIFISIAIFATTVIYSANQDDYFSLSFKKVLLFGIYIIVFIIISYVFFMRLIPGFKFVFYSSILLIFFMTNIFKFNYRMMIYLSYAFILTYNIVYFQIKDIVIEEYSIFGFNLFLMTAIIISIFGKTLAHKIVEQNKSLIRTNKRLEEMMESTLSLIKVRDTLDTEDVTFKNSYLKDIHKIAMKIFDKVDNSFCFTNTDNYVEFISSKGYDLDFLNNLKIKSNSINWERLNPRYTTDATTQFKMILNERFHLFSDMIPKLKESVIIVIEVFDSEYGIISFDIAEGSPYSITKDDLDNIGAFQKLINSFFEMNKLSLKNSDLKDEIVLSLIRTLELYDQYTGGHSEDVAEISQLIAKKMKLSEDEISRMYWAGIVHDIGKIGIPSEIINKPSKLTLDEYKKVKEHPVYGFEILSKSSELKDIAILVKHHHEWWNGSGYPEGLSQTKIPLGAQILGVADSVSSMATLRPYSKQKNLLEIIDELEMYKGTQFSPDIADIMIELIKEGKIDDIFKERLKV
jgi:hypothetical protein